MPVPPDQRETVAFLTALAGAPPVETHISFVFLGSDTAWKLKKSVRLPFLDFTARDDRRHFCERELALNAPESNGLYRDVIPVVRTPQGLQLGGDGDILDWVVRMARVPAGDFLDQRAAAGDLTPVLLDQIADAVASYHQAQPPLVDVQPEMAWIADGNRTSALSAGLQSAPVDVWTRAMTATLGQTEEWRAGRAAAGFVRRCHGDLHLGNLCLWRGAPVLFDALEFDERMARIDVAYDLAFLLMDLEHQVTRAAANRVLNRYVARTGDAGLVRGLPMFLSMRAMVRAHVEARSAHPRRAGPYLDMAINDLSPPKPLVIAVGGLPGTGKSTLARALAPELGAAPGALILRSDEIRKRQHGVAPEQKLPQSAYASTRSEAVFAELTAAAHMAAEAGHAVIADATFMDSRQRAQIESAAAAAGVPFLGLWLHAPRAILEERVAARTGDASDATVDVLRRAARGDPGPGRWCPIDTTDGTVALALAKRLVRSHIVF
jgi:uncharacterized protein